MSILLPKTNFGVRVQRINGGSAAHANDAVLRATGVVSLKVRAGAQPAVVDFYDQLGVTKEFSATDGAVHTASPGDETSAAFDAAVFDAAIDAYANSGKPFVPISGIWVYGNNTDITEASPVKAPALVAWKEPMQRRLFDQTGMRGVVVTSSVVYGDGGGGMPGIILGSPSDAAGNLIMLGTGSSTGRRSTSPTWPPFGASWRTTPLAGST